jgi:hypothetical protein
MSRPCGHLVDFRLRVNPWPWLCGDRGGVYLARRWDYAVDGFGGKNG